MAKVNLSSPWVEFYHEIEAMFRYDPELKVVYDEDANTVKLYVDYQNKAEALMQLLPAEKTWGNVVLKIEVIPANTEKELTDADLFRIAFENNPAFAFDKTVEGIFENPMTYIVFRNKVVQFWNDNLGDVYGNKSTLYQEIAKDIFGQKSGVFYCTDTEEPVTIATPLGEWP
jgi:hypothetical protein